MIVPMKKIHMVVQKKDIIPALETLRDLGSVHVEHQDPLTGYQLEERREEVEILEKTIGILKAHTPKQPIVQKEILDWTEVVNLNLELAAEIEHYKESIAKRQVLISQWEPWGDFNPNDIAVLAARGVFIRLCTVPKDKKEDLPSGVILQTIYTAGGMERCVAISREDIALPFEGIDLPAMGLGDMLAVQEKEQARIGYAVKTIQEHTCYLDSLVQTLAERQDVLSFEEVERGMREEDDLAVLKGFCPAEACSSIQQKAKAESWAVLFEDPTDEDQVPTLLNNPKWVNLSKPAFDMIEIMPGYGERDVSAVFIVFFTLFFAMLIGDAAYGLIFASVIFFCQKKFKGKVVDQTPFHLGYLLTGFTVLWGVLTGTYFGQQWLPSPVGPIVPWLNESSNIQWLCFTVALAHLSLARVWAASVKFPDLTFLAEVGWLFIVWGMYFLANMFVLNAPFPFFAPGLFIIGISLALFFMMPFKELLKKAPMEMIPFILGVIGAGTDIVSYIRLFAVGLATVAVADAANYMPQALPKYGIGYGFMFLLHMLNMILAIMAILVHAIRLNVLEFSGHLGMEWSGFKYNPFYRKLKQA